MENPARTSSRIFRRRPVYLVILIPLLLIAASRVRRHAPVTTQQAEYAIKTPTFTGSSGKLQQTIIVPTLDSSLPTGRNVIWCSSFQLAWNELRDKVFRAPLEITGAQEIADRLNAAKSSASDLDAKSVYAAGGWVDKGIRETIRKDMAAKFPSHTLPDFNDYTDGMLAYSYLTAGVPFKFPFRQVHEGITFTDSQGVQSQVAGFGLWQGYLEPYKDLRGQIEVLYARRDENANSCQIAECAIDLCRHSQPYQVIVAKVEPEGSLAETLERVVAEIKASEKWPHTSLSGRFNETDQLRLPEMFWRIDHRFDGLIGKVVANTNPPMPVVEAIQTIEFHLDRCGAALESESMVAVRCSPRYFNFDRPFLVYMQKRGAERPFFVMWVDNAELLVRR